jgi:hypothetical protein
MIKPKYGPEMFVDAICPVMTKPKVKKMLLELCDLVDMSPISRVHIVWGAEYNPGITANLFIEFSNITIHTFTRGDRECFFLNLFSCKPFDSRKVRSYLRKNGITHISSRVIKRKFKI